MKYITFRKLLLENLGSFYCKSVSRHSCCKLQDSNWNRRHFKIIISLVMGTKNTKGPKLEPCGAPQPITIMKSIAFRRNEIHIIKMNAFSSPALKIYTSWRRYLLLLAGGGSAARRAVIVFPFILRLMDRKARPEWNWGIKCEDADDESKR